MLNHPFAMRVTTPPTSEPVTLAEAKLHARVDYPHDDALINGLITAARVWCETYTHRAFITQTITLNMDLWPCQGGAGYTSAATIWLPRPPLASVTTVKYYDTTGTQQTLSASTDYETDTAHEPGRVQPRYTKYWPSLYQQANAIEIIYIAGESTLPAAKEPIKTAMKQLITQHYRHREPQISGTIIADIRFTLEALLDQFRIEEFVS